MMTPAQEDGDKYASATAFQELTKTVAAHGERLATVEADGKNIKGMVEKIDSDLNGRDGEKGLKVIIGEFVVRQDEREEKRDRLELEREKERVRLEKERDDARKELERQRDRNTKKNRWIIATLISIVGLILTVVLALIHLGDIKLGISKIPNFFHSFDDQPVLAKGQQHLSAGDTPVDVPRDGR